MISTTFLDEACMGYPSERPESSCAKSGRDSTTCCPKSHTFQVAGGGPGLQVAGSAFPTANRQPLIPIMGDGWRPQVAGGGICVRRMVNVR